jgi:xanthine dehydrogenase molybdopterin-binding subunit B
VRYLGQPVFAVIAETRDDRPPRGALARSADDRAAAGDPDAAVEAHAAGQYVLPPMHLARGDARAAPSPPRRTGWKATLDVGGQEQFYLEGQISYAVPKEDRGMLVHCSTQHPSEMQHLVAHALGLHSHHVQVECRRMGGGFGGKESQSALFACVAGIAARKLQRPVKLRLDRDDDFLITGKRHCFHYDYESASTTTAASSAPKLSMVSRAGFSADLSGPVMTRAVCHFDNAYFCPTSRSTATRQDQHAEQHRVPRLRRPAGHDRDRVHDRRHRARARQGSARRARATSTATTSATSRRTARRSRTTSARARRRARGEQRLPRAPRRDRAPSTRAARC